MVHYLHQQEMLQRLPIAFAQVKAGSTSDNLLTEIKQIVYSLHQAKEMSKKMFNNLIKLINLWNEYNIHEFRKQNRYKKRWKKLLHNQIVVSTTRGKIWKPHIKAVDFKCQLLRGMKNLN